ncbi:IgGFc-binding protein-like [Spea bombifrons]|uniref:IgGFc-binding protein-like n=1 Tax=Spea bombifrons TaxID=233779 RepID=UPI00234AB1F6|nr:IgGFc-binding protein-like [Spea bombifrons]
MVMVDYGRSRGRKRGDGLESRQGIELEYGFIDNWIFLLKVATDLVEWSTNGGHQLEGKGMKWGEGGQFHGSNGKGGPIPGSKEWMIQGEIPAGKGGMKWGKGGDRSGSKEWSVEGESSEEKGGKKWGKEGPHPGSKEWMIKGGVPPGKGWMKWGFKGGATVGRKFVTTFLQNHGSNEIPQVEFLITGIYPSTQVTLTISNTGFRKEVTVNKGETVSVPITEPVEMLGTDTSPRSVVIEADHGVTVVSRSSKHGSSDTALLYPVDWWGSLYYIVTPPWGPDTEYKEFAIISNDMPTNVTMHLKGDVKFQGKDYPKGSILRVTLEPNQATQIQSKDDLSGTKIEAQYQVSVLSGHTCAQKNGNCGHVYEQLLPVERWGDTYFVPGLSFQPKSDIVMVMAYQPTELTYQSGTKKGQKTINEGEMVTFDVSPSFPLSLRSNNYIQVLLFGTGGSFPPFLSNAPDIMSFGLKYVIPGQNNVDNNEGVIIIKMPGQSGITIDEKAPKGIQWRKFPGSEYSWGEFRLPRGFSFHTIEHPTMPFGLLSIGYSPSMSYGSIAPCLKVLPVPGGNLPLGSEWTVEMEQGGNVPFGPDWTVEMEQGGKIPFGPEWTVEVEHGNPPLGQAPEGPLPGTKEWTVEMEQGPGQVHPLPVTKEWTVEVEHGNPPLVQGQNGRWKWNKEVDSHGRKAKNAHCRGQKNGLWKWNMVNFHGQKGKNIHFLEQKNGSSKWNRVKFHGQKNKAVNFHGRKQKKTGFPG